MKCSIARLIVEVIFCTMAKEFLFGCSSTTSLDLLRAVNFNIVLLVATLSIKNAALNLQQATIDVAMTTMYYSGRVSPYA